MKLHSISPARLLVSSGNTPRACSATRWKHTVQATRGGGISNADEAFVPGREGEERRALFNRISKSYDSLNDQLSFGQHKIWKRMAVKWCAAKPGHNALDVCCGSGDLAFLLASVVGSNGSVSGLDFAQEMLDDAERRQRAQQRESWRPQGAARMQWIQGDAMEMPFKTAEFDCATMGYGLRNVSNIPAALAELYRVLKPGGKVAILDFNNASNPLLDGVQGFLLENMVVPAARAQGLEEEYKYLRPSIKRFPPGPEQEKLALQAGFKRAIHYPIGFGFMGVLVAEKLR